jgi:anti-sigma regulatory factor (Ser/Thr protein kinase)
VELRRAGPPEQAPPARLSMVTIAAMTMQAQPMQPGRDQPRPFLIDGPLRAVLDLGAVSAAPGCARAWTRQVLWEWRLTGLADNAELVVSELTTNSVLASRWQVRAAIQLTLICDRQQLVVLVRDSEPGTPTRRHAGADDESGRGLLLVESLSDRFGWYLADDGAPGKVVWAALSVPPSSRMS